MNVELTLRRQDKEPFTSPAPLVLSIAVMAVQASTPFSVETLDGKVVLDFDGQGVRTQNPDLGYILTALQQIYVQGIQVGLRDSEGRVSAESSTSSKS